jgi:RNA polymerase sporulation-specific sigma factor
MTTEQKRLTENNLRLVYYTYERLGKTDFVKRNKDDIVSEGTVGLIKAVKTYKADKSKFATYASRCIRNEMLMFLRRNKKHAGVLSLYQSVGHDNDGHELLLMDTISDEAHSGERMSEAIEAKETLAQILAVADGRERLMIAMRIDGKKQKDIAARLGLSRSYVSRLFRQLKQRYKGEPVKMEKKKIEEAA